MNLGQAKRELEIALMAARTIAEARPIIAKLRELNAKIKFNQAVAEREQDPTGRLADLRYLAREFDRAPSGAARAKIAQTAAAIRSEPESVRRMRAEMVRASRRGDKLRAREIGEHLALR